MFQMFFERRNFSERLLKTLKILKKPMYLRFWNHFWTQYQRFREVFRRFHEIFPSFRKIFEVFGRVWTCLDLLGPLRTHSDAFKFFRKRSDVSQNRKYPLSCACLVFMLGLFLGTNKAVCTV